MAWTHEYSCIIERRDNTNKSQKTPERNMSALSIHVLGEFCSLRNTGTKQSLNICHGYCFAIVHNTLIPTMQVPPKVMIRMGNSVRRSGAFVVRRGLSFIVNGVCIFFILGVRSWTGLIRTLEPEGSWGTQRSNFFLVPGEKEQRNGQILSHILCKLWGTGKHRGKQVVL